MIPYHIKHILALGTVGEGEGDLGNPFPKQGEKKIIGDHGQLDKRYGFLPFPLSLCVSLEEPSFFAIFAMCLVSKTLNRDEIETRYWSFNETEVEMSRSRQAYIAVLHDSGLPDIA